MPGYKVRIHLGIHFTGGRRWWASAVNASLVSEERLRAGCQCSQGARTDSMGAYKISVGGRPGVQSSKRATASRAIW